MGFTYTKEQQSVIELHNRNLLVAAAAGSGKTAVLVERIVRMVSDEESHVDIDRLLIVTFTKAAAAEMRERIRQAIERRILEEPENRHLKKQSTLLHNALITTIDSFCLYVIRNNFNEIGLDPDFRVGDEGEMQLLFQDAMSEMMEQFFAEGEDGFYELLEAFCPDGKEKKLEDYISGLYRYAQSYPFPEEWLDRCTNDNVMDSVRDMENKPWMISGMVFITRQLDSLIEQMKNAIELCNMEGGPSGYLSLFMKELGDLQDISSKENYHEMSAVIRQVEFARLPVIKKGSAYDQIKERAKNIRTNVKDTVIQMQKKYFFQEPDQIVMDQKICGRLTSVLVRMTKELERIYTIKKAEKKVITFNDIEHFALNILVKKEANEYVPTEAAKDYQQYFYEILIDEYQDSNLVQEYLLKSISREGMGQNNRFMVGDVKQSIYKFRLARPEIFMEKYDSYSNTDSPCQKIELSCNFRSRKEVIDSVNHVFHKIMRKELGNVEYDERSQLYLGASYEAASGNENKTEYVILDVERGNQEEARRTEARYIAARIRSCVGKMMITQKDGSRRCATYKDIIILLRTTSGWDDIFREVFELEQIPVVTASKTGYFSASEIQTLMNLIRVLNNPYQDIPLFGVMTSSFGGFDENMIALMKCHGEHLYTCLKRAAGMDESKTVGDRSTDSEDNQDMWKLITKKAIILYSMIQKYRNLAVYLPIHELLLMMIRENHYLEIVSAMPQGVQRHANVDMLIEKAREFGETSYKGLFHFVRYMEQLQKYQVDYGEASLTDESADAVSIMSIHKCKGLEFPICFLAGTGKEFNLRDYTQSILMDIDLGISAKMIDVSQRVTSDSLYRNMMSTKGILDSLGEEIRLLYVAMTRAKEKLIITGVSAKAEERVNAGKLLTPTGERSSYIDLAQSRSFMDFLLLAYESEDDPIEFRVLSEDGAEDMVFHTHVEKQFIREQLLHEIESINPTKVREEAKYQLLQERLHTAYAHQNLSCLYTKTTVSELKMAAMENIESVEDGVRLFKEEQADTYIPVFMEERAEVSGTTRGTAYHRILELLDLKEDLDESRLKQQLAYMIERGDLVTEYADMIRMDKLITFGQSMLCKRMAKADAEHLLFREQPFVLGLPASKVNPEFPDTELVLIQGIIDVYFEEDGELVLADYKTDKVDNAEKLALRYRAQLDYYSQALEQLTGKRVKEKIIYSFYLSLAITL